METIEEHAIDSPNRTATTEVAEAPSQEVCGDIKELEETECVVPLPENERVHCAIAMSRMLHGDVTSVQPFVLALVAYMSLGLPDPRDKVEVIHHLAKRSGTVLADLFCLTQDQDQERVLVLERASTLPPLKYTTPVTVPSRWVLLRNVACVAFGVLLSSHVSSVCIVGGAMLHPAFVTRSGHMWCVPLFVWLGTANTASMTSMFSIVVGVLLTEAATGFTLLVGAWQK